MYSSELWQVPFAYFGVTGIGLAQIAARAPHLLSPTLLLAATFGFFVVVHMRRIRALEQRAVRRLRRIEMKLRIMERALGSSEPHIYQYAVGVLVAGYLIAAVLLVKCGGA